jgi:hypothetical protein
MMPTDAEIDADYILALCATIDKLTAERDKAIAALAEAERKGMERAAEICETTSVMFDITVWLESTKKEMTTKTALALAATIRAEMKKEKNL